jgi:hypothetical protein
MKKTSFILTLLIGVITILSCNSSSQKGDSTKTDSTKVATPVASNNDSQANSPEKVTELFVNAINAGQFGEAKKYCTSKTYELFTMIPDKKKTTTGNKVTIISSKINGKIATVRFKDGNEESITTLENVNGNWLIAITKADHIY